jgi:hypothetical protein
VSLLFRAPLPTKENVAGIVGKTEIHFTLLCLTGQPIIVMATLAAVIASQALISGSYIDQ